MHYNTVTK